MLSPLRLSLDPSPTTTVFFRRLIDYLRAAIHKSASYMPLADNDDEVDDDAEACHLEWWKTEVWRDLRFRASLY